MSRSLQYLVRTTTGDKWEITGGAYLTYASNSDDAKGIIQKHVDKKVTKETISTVERIYKNAGYGHGIVIDIQEPVVE